MTEYSAKILTKPVKIHFVVLKRIDKEPQGKKGQTVCKSKSKHNMLSEISQTEKDKYCMVLHVESKK